jgi:hypothetical protein
MRSTKGRSSQNQYRNRLPRVLAAEASLKCQRSQAIQRSGAAIQQFAARSRRFPVPSRQFPVLRKKFPVRLRREFACQVIETALKTPNLFPAEFPFANRDWFECRAETGSSLHRFAEEEYLSAVQITLDTAARWNSLSDAARGRRRLSISLGRRDARRSMPDAMQSKELLEEIGDPRFGTLADELIRSEPVDLISGEAQLARAGFQVRRDFGPQGR